MTANMSFNLIRLLLSFKLYFERQCPHCNNTISLSITPEILYSHVLLNTKITSHFQFHGFPPDSHSYGRHGDRFPEQTTVMCLYRLIQVWQDHKEPNGISLYLTTVNKLFRGQRRRGVPSPLLINLRWAGAAEVNEVRLAVFWIN